HRRLQILSFVDDHNESIAGARLLQQPPVELFVHAHEISAFTFVAQFSQQESHELAGGALGLKQKCGSRRVAELLQQMKEDGSLAHAGLGDEAKESTVRLDAVIQGGQRLSMGCAEIQESRVRGYSERLLPQSEILLIHAALLPFQRCAPMPRRSRNKLAIQLGTLAMGSQAGDAAEPGTKKSSKGSIRRALRSVSLTLCPKDQGANKRIKVIEPEVSVSGQCRNVR